MALLLIAIVFVVVGFRIFLWYHNSPEAKGKQGETRVSSILCQLPKEYSVLNDVVLKTEKGTTQIDHVVVSPYGVFVIETKNYSGTIYGDDNQRQWTQLIITDVRYRRKWYKTYTYVTKNRFYNPVKQSLSHLYEIKKNLSEWHQLKIVPIVVFTGSADLSNVQSNNYVVYDTDLVSTIQRFQTICLSSQAVQNVIERLSEKNMRDVVDNKTHVQNISTTKIEFERKIESGICPKCGGTLVQRNGRYGSFYGCSNYPNCKFTTHR